MSLDPNGPDKGTELSADTTQVPSSGSALPSSDDDWVEQFRHKRAPSIGIAALELVNIPVLELSSDAVNDDDVDFFSGLVSNCL